MAQNYFTLFFRYLALAILSITLEQGFKSPSNMNSGELLDLNGHIKAKLMFKSENLSCMNYLALEPVLFERPHNIIIKLNELFPWNIQNIWLKILALGGSQNQCLS